MALESDNHRDALHKFGKDAIDSISRGYPSYGQARFPYRLPKENEAPPAIPSESIFAEAINDTRRPVVAQRLPSVADCATHLELLESFYVLRQKVLRSDELDTAFGIEPKHETKTGKRGDTKKFKDKTLWDRRQVKWPIFIEIAVLRFLSWRNACNEEWPPFRVPPLDVLMVWHAFLLNPRLFQQHCREETLYRVPFPWRSIHQYIDTNEWKFTLPEKAAQVFENKTGLTGDLFEELSRWKDQEAAGKTTVEGSWAKLRLEELEEGLRTAESDSESGSQLAKHFGALSKIDIDLAIQLRDAVIRQGSFVEKMSNHLWIRSPALAGTMSRAIDRYAKFLHLMKLYPKEMLVPTLDIDLAWHTHQCDAIDYTRGTKERVGRFINHDDTIVENKLTDGFSNTRRLFRVHFGKDYKVCGCWDCETLLTALEDAIKAKTAGEVIDMAALVRKVEVDVTYYRAVEVARRKKEPLPVRDESR